VVAIFSVHSEFPQLIRIFHFQAAYVILYEECYGAEVGMRAYSDELVLEEG
jgi:hypothetical protein